MSVDHRRFDVPMAEQFLNRPDIIAILKQVGGKAVAQRVTTNPRAQPGFAGSLFHSPLQYRLMQMMPPLDPRARVERDLGCWKYPLPAPFFICLGVFTKPDRNGLIKE
jgi:hypothetical protein